MVVGAQLRQFKREIAVHDHAVIDSAGEAVIYCVHCHESDVVKLLAESIPALLRAALAHRARCPVRLRRREQEDANEGT